MSVTEYFPVAGLTIKDAFQRVKVIAIKEGVTTIAHINDIIMCISQKTDISEALNLYTQRVDLKYEIEKNKNEKQK